MLQPKRTKFRKAFKGRIHGDAKGGATLNFGAYGLKAMEPDRITARQIEAARRAITRHMRRQGRLWIRVFPDVPVSAKTQIDFQGSSDDQLSEQLGNLKREQFNLRFQAATNQLEKPSRVREVRKDIARIKTVQAQRTSAASAK